MGMTMTQKILAAHAGLPEVHAGDLIEADLDIVLGNDVTTPVAVGVFEKIVSKSTEPDHYRILAILLDGSRRTSEALAVLDTAEVRFGRIPLLGRLRQYYL